MELEDCQPQSAHAAPLIDNPLTLIPLEDLETIVDRFYERTIGLEDVVQRETLFKGAQLVRDPYDYYTPGLTQSEENAILAEGKEEKAHWFMPPEGLHVTILATACAAITQGWQQSTINASSMFNWQKDLDVENREYLIGALNAAPWLSGSIIGTWISDPLQEKFFGRRPALCIAAVFCVACVIGTAHCDSWQTLLVCRLLLGIGIGSKASIAPVFAAEAAPDKQRGRVLMTWQLFDAFGIFLGFVCAFIVRDDWRVLLATAVIPAIALLFVVYVCPESPRFLIRQNRYPDAYKSLRRLRRTDIQAARDLFSIHAQLQAETTAIWKTEQQQEWHASEIYQDWIKDTNFYQRTWYLFTKPRVRRACLVASLVMASQQLCGINILAFYSSDLFSTGSVEQGGMTAQDEYHIKWFNLCFGLAMFLFTFVAYRHIDSRGRRFLLLISLGGMAVSLAVVSSLFYIPDPKVRRGLVASVSIAIFTFFYSLGGGPIPFTLSPEVFPLCVREVGMSFSVMVNFLGLGLLVLFVPQLTKAFGDACDETNSSKKSGCDGQANLLFFFSGLNVLAFILVFLLVPETNEVALESMNKLFEKTTQQHVMDNMRALRKRQVRSG